MKYSSLTQYALVIRFIHCLNIKSNILNLNTYSKLSFGMHNKCNRCDLFPFIYTSQI